MHRSTNQIDCRLVSEYASYSFNSGNPEKNNMLNISGLDQLHQQLIDVKKALESLDSEFVTVIIDPHDPASIEAAIQDVETTIDQRLGPYASNTIIAPLAENIKKQYRESILDRAAAQRLERGRDLS